MHCHHFAVFLFRIFFGQKPWPEQSEQTAQRAHANFSQHERQLKIEAALEDLQECQSELHSRRLAHPSPHGSCQHCHSQ